MKNLGTLFGLHNKRMEMNCLSSFSYIRVSFLKAGVKKLPLLLNKYDKSWLQISNAVFIINIKSGIRSSSKAFTKSL